MGCHGAIEIYLRGSLEKTPVIDLDDEYQEGDLCWLETPVNPMGVSRWVNVYGLPYTVPLTATETSDIQYYANKVLAA